jgi:hypothetical protein
MLTGQLGAGGEGAGLGRGFRAGNIVVINKVVVLH